MHLMGMSSLESIGKAIRQRRKVLTVTQAHLAQIAGLSIRSVKAIEKGEANPTWKQMEKILGALGWEFDLKEKVS